MYNLKSEKIIDPENVPPIHVIGCGGTGSFLAASLGKLGIKDVTLYDFDIVEAKNVGNQLFGKDDVGKKKVDALKEYIKNNCNMVYKTVDTKIDAETAEMEGIVFVLTDSMSNRIEILDANEFNSDCQVLIETRLGVYDGRVYIVDPNNSTQIEKYRKTLYMPKKTKNVADDELVSACGIRQDLVASSMLLSSLAIFKLIRYINKGNTEINEAIINYESSIFVIENSWE